MPQVYEGYYAKFKTDNRGNLPILMGADTLVGDEYTVEFNVDGNNRRSKITNRFGGEVGYFPPGETQKLRLLYAREWTVHVLLSFIACTDSGNGGEYWGEMCIIAYDPSKADVFDVFTKRISSLLGEGVRPDVNLSQQGVASVISNNGEWEPTGRVPFPTKKKGVSIVKDHLRTSEKMVERGRNRNVGCYIVSILFIVVVVFLVFWLLLSFGVIKL